MTGKLRLRGIASLFLLLVLLFSFASVSYAQQPASPQSDAKFRFVVLPDMHFHGEESDNALAVRRAAVNKVIDDIKPAFVIQTGDVIDLEGQTQANQEFITKSFASLERELVAKLEQNNIPLLYSPGNHDGAESSDFRSPASISAYDEFWSRHKPKTITIDGEFGQYYSFDYKNSHFAALYAPGAGLKSADVQNAWLKDDLAKARSSGLTNIFVFGHPPLHSPKLINCEDRSDKKFLQNDQTFMNTLLTYQVNLYIGGHIHVYVEQKTGGVNEIIDGMLSGGRRTLASLGRTQPFTFTVVDVEGDKIDPRPIEFKSELGDFDTSELSPAPAVDSPLSAPEPIEQLAAASVCPAGTHPSGAALGTVAGMNAPAGISLPTEVGALDSSSILSKAKVYEGRPYGTSTGAFTDASFIVQLLGDLGISLSPEAETAILGVGGADPGSFQSALTDSGVAQSVSVDDVKPGDFVYYSLQDAGVTKNVVGIIESVTGGGKFVIYGAHESLNKVTSLPDVSLAPPVSSAIVRINPSASVPATQPPATPTLAETQPAAGSPETPSTPAPTQQPSAAASITGCGTRIAAVGDSITQGASYIRYLRTMCGPDTAIQNDDGDPATPSTIKHDWPAGTVQGDKFAYIGKRTNQMLKDFDAVLATNPETVIIMGGTNGIVDSWESSKNDLEKMYNAAKAKGMRVVALTIPPYENPELRAKEGNPAKIADNVRKLNNWIMTQSPADIKVDIYTPLVDPSQPDSANPALFGGDLVHPKEEGKRIMAQKVFEKLSGAAVPSVSAAPSAGPLVPAPTSPVTCIPDSTLSQVLYDFIINSTFGSTTIVGIARQNIAIGISKETQQVSAGAVCVLMTSDRDYDADFLKATYGRSQMEVESQLVDVQFMGKPVKVHRLIQPALGCVEQSINACAEGKAYDFSSIASYEWVGVDNSQDLLATSSFGISININLDRNPNSQDGELRTDLPQCVIDAFKKFGFRWGGEFGSVKSPSYFVFMASPAQVAVQEAFTCPAGMDQFTGTDGIKTCKPAPPLGPGENAVAKERFAKAIEALGKGLPYDEQTKHPSCCGDWLAMVYKWSGYAYRYEGTGDYEGLDAVAQKHGYPIGYNDNRGSAGHALMLLGFGPAANWWLEKFPDIPIRSGTRSVGENEALVISYLGSESKKVEFWTYPRGKYPERIKNTKPGQEGPAKITFVHTLIPLCQGTYLQEKANGEFGSKYAGMMYWSNDQSGGGDAWSRYWEPDSAYYPKGGQCSSATGVA
jgi:lysophospholipase L1-like esterase